MMVIWNAMKERKYAVCGNFQMHDKKKQGCEVEAGSFQLFPTLLP